jgi:NTE family protein
MKLGLVMGGGGLVGIAWETGVLAALQEECGFDPSTAAIVIGSSAGSVTGAQAALGRDFGELAERLQKTARPRSDERDAGTGAARALPDFSQGPQAEIMQLMTQGGGAETGKRIGELAMQCETALSEDTYVESFRSMLGTDEWPDVDLRVTTCECETGRGLAWSRDDGVDLVRAVASSCAVPGFFPTVSFGDHHYTDGPRSVTVDLLADAGVDAALFIGPNAALGAFAEMMEREFDAIRDRGIELATVTGGEALAEIGLNLMDPALRATGAEIGLADGREAAASVRSLLAG